MTADDVAMLKGIIVVTLIIVTIMYGMAWTLRTKDLSAIECRVTKPNTYECWLRDTEGPETARSPALLGG